MEKVFVGIDVAFAKGKRLPVVVSTVRDGALEPLPLRLAVSKPPPGAGNAQALRPDIRQALRNRRQTTCGKSSASSTSSSTASRSMRPASPKLTVAGDGYAKSN
jgi:hypothetical protein